MLFLRARYYNSANGRFQSRDTWSGDYNRPLSLNRWMYVEGNPVNFVDPSGNIRKPCVLLGGWDANSVKKRVDEAEKYVYQSSDPMDTYIAAGIAIQCAGYDRPFSSYSGLGIAQITRKQTKVEWGEEIEDIWGRFRGYGLRLRCPDGELEEELDPLNAKDAVILMGREIQIVMDECKNCTDTDRYIVAALAQNGPGFSYIRMRGIPNITPKIKELYGFPNAGINKDWFSVFDADDDHGDMINTKIQLVRFNLVINELQSRSWVVPYIDSSVIQKLKNW